MHILSREDTKDEEADGLQAYPNEESGGLACEALILWSELPALAIAPAMAWMVMERMSIAMKELVV
jgi:hypothetical protein